MPKQSTFFSIVIFKEKKEILIVEIFRDAILRYELQLLMIKT